MNEIIIVILILTIFTGILFSFWSIKQTREKYYNDFMQKRNDRKNIKEA